MPKKSPPLDDLRKLDADLEEGSSLVIEDGLRLKVKNGRKLFEARYRKNGLYRSRLLGSHPEATIEEVRIKKQSFFAETEAALATPPPEFSSASETKTRSKSKSNTPQEERRYFLKTEAHCWELLRNLLFSHIGFAREHSLAILLLLALPARPKDLLTAKWSDLQWNKLLHGQIRHPTRTAVQRSYEWSPAQRFSWVSPTCERLFGDLRILTGKHEYMFPSLAEMDAQERTAKLNDILDDVWHRYPIRINGLQYTFSELAKKYTEFHPDFIDSLVSKKYRLAPLHEIFYEFQCRSVLAWWGSNLDRLLKMETYISKHDFSRVSFEFKLPTFQYMLI